MNIWNFLNKQPKEKKITIKGLNEENLEVFSLKETVLKASLDNNIKFPHKCKAGGCGTCKCVLESGEIKELKDASYVLSEKDLEDGYILACQSIPKTDITISVK